MRVKYDTASLTAAPGSGWLSLVQHGAVNAPGAPARKGEIEEYEAENDRQFPAVHDRVNRARRVGHEIGEGHFAGEDERNDPGVCADQEQESADRFEERRENQEAAKRWDRGGGGKVEYFREPVLQEQKSNDNAQDAEDIGPPRLQRGEKCVNIRLPSLLGQVRRMSPGERFASTAHLTLQPALRHRSFVWLR